MADNASMTGAHRLEDAFGRAWLGYVLIPGKVPRSFWRVPVDLRSYTEAMRFGMRVQDGEIVPVSAEEPGSEWGGTR